MIQAQRIMKNLTKIRLEETDILYTIIADFFQNNYVVRLQPILQTQTRKTNITLLGRQNPKPSYAGTYAVCYGFSTIETDRVFASDRLLNSESESNNLAIELGDYLNAS